MKQILILCTLVFSLHASERIDNQFKCIDNKLFIQTVVYEKTPYEEHIVSASLIQVFSQLGSTIAITDCRTHDAKIKIKNLQ